MKCPRCGAKNDKSRTVCINCAMFLRRSSIRVQMTQAEMNRLRTRKVLRIMWKGFKFVWFMFGLIVLSFLFIALALLLLD